MSDSEKLPIGKEKHMEITGAYFENSGMDGVTALPVGVNCVMPYGPCPATACGLRMSDSEKLPIGKEKHMEITGAYFENSGMDGLALSFSDGVIITGNYVEFSDDMAQFLAHCFMNGLTFQQAMDKWMVDTGQRPHGGQDGEQHGSREALSPARAGSGSQIGP